MSSKKIATGLKIIIVAIFIVGLAGYFAVLPLFGMDIAERYTEFSSALIPWLCIIWTSSIPCFTVLVLAWNVCTSIGKELTFSFANAKRISIIAFLAICDAIFFTLANIVMLLLNVSHPGVLIISLFISLVGVAIAFVAYALSSLVKNAAELQEQSDLTI